MSPQHIISVMPPLVTFRFLVVEAIVHHHFSYEMVMVTIRHYKPLLVMDLECHHNTFTFGDATFGDIQFLVTKALLTLTKELMVTIFSSHQCPFFLQWELNHLQGKSLMDYLSLQVLMKMKQLTRHLRLNHLFQKRTKKFLKWSNFSLMKTK